MPVVPMAPMAPMAPFPAGRRDRRATGGALVTVFMADEQTLSVDLPGLQRLARFVLQAQHVPEAMEVSLLCVDVEAMTQLNHHHMGAVGPTDVLAFPIDLPGESLGPEPAILGDVVLCPAVAVEQAARHGGTPDSEMQLLVVHGILHLLGHDHAEPEERDVMFALTDRLLTAFRAQAAT